MGADGHVLREELTHLVVVDALATAVLDGDGVLYQIGHGEGADKFVIRRPLAADGEATTVYASTDRPEVFANSGEPISLYQVLDLITMDGNTRY